MGERLAVRTVPEIGFYNVREKATEEQLAYIESILTKPITFVNAGAGTGKTTCAVASLRYLYDMNVISKAYYIFAPVEEKTMGFRPGDQREKDFDYTYPLRDALIKMGEDPDQATSERNGWITPKSHTFLRGTNMEGVGVIIDEAQNWTKHELKKGLTRLFSNSHSVVIGHTGQIDLKHPSDSGFQAALDLFSTDERAGVMTLSKDFRGWISKLADSL